MSFRLLLHIGSFIVVATTLIVTAGYLPPTTLGIIEPGIRWLTVVNIASNAYHSWRVDHLTNLVLDLRKSGQINDAVPVQLFILLFGTGLFLNRLRANSQPFPIAIWFLAAIIVLSILFVVGRDPVALGSFTWVPLLALFLSGGLVVARHGSVRAALPLWLILLFTGVQHAQSANQLGLLTALGAAALACFMETGYNHNNPLRPKVLAFAALLALGPSFVTAIAAPHAPFPDYPSLAHVVPLSGVPGAARPLVGPDYPFPTIDRSALRAIFSLPVSFLLGGAALTWVLGMRMASRPLQAALCFGTLVFASVWLDVYPGTNLRTMSPVASISRLLPGVSLMDLAPALLVSALWFVSGALVSAGASLAVVPWILCLFAATVSAYTSHLHTVPSAQRLDFSERCRASAEQRRMLISPSLSVVRYFLISLPDLLDRTPNYVELSELSASSVAAHSPEIEASPEILQRSVPRLIDGRAETRWSTRGSGQVGDESLVLRFPAPVALRGLELSTGTFPTDFPRGLVVASLDCDSLVAKNEISFPDWQGSLVFTRSGYPYFSGQSEVRVFFEQTTTMRCISIKQTSKAPFDWSIAELGLFAPTPDK